MTTFLRSFAVMLMLISSFSAIHAQITTGSISGTVSDSTGAVVPGATVNIQSESGQRYTATTNDNGYYNVPGVTAGSVTYTVRITAVNFKTAVIQNVKVDVATPVTVNGVLEAGRIEETVVVTGGAEVLQTETSTVGSTITGRQILETPIQSRDALDLVTLMPGTAVIGTARTSSINGLPKSALTVQIDGVDVNDNYLKSSDGFFTFIRPRLDSIDEVTVSTSNPGQESGGDAAVAIKFATRRGTDDYHGSFFWQHRDESLNAANFTNNYQGIPRQKMRLNQFGGSVGGPIPFLNFGEGVDWFDSGKGKRYFFLNYERFHLNEVSSTRTRQVLTEEAQNGVFRYGGGGASSANLLALAQSADCDAAAPGTQACLVGTVDPTLAGVFDAIRSATAIRGTFSPALGNNGTWFSQPFNFQNPGEQRRRFLTMRFDFNVTKNHALEAIYQDQPFRQNVDFLNSVDPAFPDFSNAGTQNSDRRSLSVGVRSNFGQNVVNQFRYAQLAGWLGGSSGFALVGGNEFFENLMGGYSFSFASFSSTAIAPTSPTIRNAFSDRVSPVRDLTNNLTWVKGNHTMTFGAQMKRVETISDDVGLVVPPIQTGVATVADDNLLSLAFNTTTLPGASTTELTNAKALYAAITGRIATVNYNGVLGPDGKYAVNGSRHFEIQEDQYGVFAQDNWRVAPNLTLSYGLRWQPVLGPNLNTANYAVLVDPGMIYDVSGPGNQFAPGTLSGTAPAVRGNTIGERAYENDLDNFAPSVGFVWSPEGAPGFLGRLVGRNGASAFRGGWSRNYIREGTLVVETSIGRNPGGSFSLARQASTGTLVVGTNFRDPGNPNLAPPAFTDTPTFPRSITSSDNMYAFSPDFRTGYVDSYSFGFQRQIGKDTVVEVRYVGNRGRDMQSNYNLNEANLIENGLGEELRLAQANLQRNIAAGRGANFRYVPSDPLTFQLPILVSYLAGGGTVANNGNNYDPSTAAAYASANFASSTLVNFLSPANTNFVTFASTMESTAAFRTNAYTAGTFRGARPINFINNCPTTIGFCFQFDNSEKSWYDSVQIELRRRLSAGLRVNANYTYGKAFTNAFASASTPFYGLAGGDQGNASNVSLRNRDLDKSPAQIDIRHAFKLDATWDLPFGKGERFASSQNWFSNALFGGWTLAPTIRWQSGSPVLLENVQLVGMTAEELQDAIGAYKNVSIPPLSATGNPAVANVTWLPADIIANTIRAFTTTGSTANGYNAVNKAPEGRFIAPAGYNSCQYMSVSEVCGYRKLVLYGPSFFKMDATLIKRIGLGEKRNLEFRVTAFDVLNRTNWRLGGWTGNVNNISAFTGTFGQMQSTWSYQDPSGSNDPGGRMVDLMVRVNW